MLAPGNGVARLPCARALMARRLATRTLATASSQRRPSPGHGMDIILLDSSVVRRRPRFCEFEPHVVSILFLVSMLTQSQDHFLAWQWRGRAILARELRCARRLAALSCVPHPLHSDHQRVAAVALSSPGHGLDVIVAPGTRNDAERRCG